VADKYRGGEQWAHVKLEPIFYINEDVVCFMGSIATISWSRDILFCRTCFSNTKITKDSS